MAVTRFWVGGTGTWDSTTTTNWSTLTGGASGASVPGVGDTATFDTNSGANTITTNYAVSIAALNLSGTFAGTVTLGATNTCTITGAITHVSGTLNTNGQTCNWGNYTGNNATAHTLTPGASTINCSFANGTVWVGNTTGQTVTANTATVNITGVNPTITTASTNWNGMSFNISGGGAVAFSGLYTGTANATITDPGGGCTVTMNNNATINTSLTLTGFSQSSPMVLISNIAGSPRTLTCNGTVTTTHLNVKDSTAAGTAVFSAFGDLGNNTNWIFQKNLTNSINNYAFVSVGDGMSSSEKIR